MRQTQIRDGIIDFAVSAAKFIYGTSLFAIGLIGSMFLAAFMVGVQIVPTSAGFGVAATRGLEAITVVTQSTGVQADLYFSLLFGGFAGGALAVAVYYKSTEIIAHLS